jgi:hypothetical protein
LLLMADFLQSRGNDPRFRFIVCCLLKYLSFRSAISTDGFILCRDLAMWSAFGTGFRWHYFRIERDDRWSQKETSLPSTEKRRFLEKETITPEFDEYSKILTSETIRSHQ